MLPRCAVVKRKVLSIIPDAREPGGYSWGERRQEKGLVLDDGRNGRIVSAIQTTNLADILERVLDKGIVIAGDITISLAEIELLNIKLRLLVASVDKAMEMGINWWQSDPSLSSRARKLEEESNLLKTRLDRLESTLVGAPQ